MNAPVLLMFLIGTNIATGAVILRETSSGIPVEILEHPNEIISISQNYENTFSSGLSSSSFATSGIPQYLHQGNNVFYHPQILTPGTNTPSVLVVPVPGEKEKADCEQNGMYEDEKHKEEGKYESEKHKDEGKYDEEKHKEDGKYKEEVYEEEGKYEADKPEEGKYEEPTSAPHLEQEVQNDEIGNEPNVIPPPPELPPLILPELPEPKPVETTETEKEEDTSKLPEKNEIDESFGKPINDEFPAEDNKPMVIPAPPELPPLVLPELPVKVTVQVPIQPAIIQAPAIPCEQHIEITEPAKPVIEIPNQQEILPINPPAPVSIAIENNVFNTESPKLEDISLSSEKESQPIIVSVIPSYPQYPASFPQPAFPQFPLQFGLAPVPAEVPPCPPQFPHNSVLQVHDYVNQLGPQYQIIPIPPYKK